MSNSQNSRKKKLEALENVHSAMGCYLQMALYIVVLVITICIFLAIAELLFPRTVHAFNYNLSSRTFVELKASHKYKAAVDFYEQKHEIFQTKGDKYINAIEVADCYKRIGEYEKAEAILRDIKELKYLTDKELKDLDKDSLMKEFFFFSIEREFFILYEEMKDIAGMRQSYTKMKSLISPENVNHITKLIQDSEEKIDLDLPSLLKSYDIKMLYYDNPKEAIAQMLEFIKSIQYDTYYKPSFILKCMNILNNWIIEQFGVVPAYMGITDAVEYAMSTDGYNDDKSEYGILSDICYKVHDIKNAKKFYTVYSIYLKDITSELDPLYIDNQIRGFKFLENEQNWTELENLVSECCTKLRSLLDKNLYLMSESQREYFVNLLSGPFDYATDLLFTHPSDNLASLCFDNAIYMKGLLLRSSREIANKIQNIGDPNLTSKYEHLQECRKELSYREGLGKIGNSIKIASLKKEIDDIDKDLAVKCAEYRQDRIITDVTSKDIQKALKKDQAAIEFVNTKSDKLLALVLSGDSKVTSVKLGSIEDINNFISFDYRQLYGNTEFQKIIWAPVDSLVQGTKDIYYSSNGVFNSISFPALCKEGRTHLADIYNFHLLSNMSNLLSLSYNMDYNRVERIAMWGDIDYGGADSIYFDSISPFRDIERGQGLKHLTYSKYEIDAIMNIFKNTSNSSPVYYSGKTATEMSFRSRSGMKDNILHISTHGFFDEDDAHRKDYDPMYNSGLFFAGADSTWNRNSIVFSASSMMDDGILRASEIQYLDFSNCSIAVLSACKTGLGHSKNTEGVYGLQRAFKLAGVEKILMSLWNVDDRCTSDFMKAFYQNLVEGNSDEEALRKAQRQIRNTYPSPEYWGAFVLLY